MKKCPACKNKSVVEQDNIFKCKKCDYINGVSPKVEALKKLVAKKEKAARKKDSDEALTKLQQERTAEPYFRFRIFIVEDRNGN